MALYNIKNVDFNHNSNIVLRIHNLKIKSREMTFILGKSGIGKSTLIESLGLMKRTFVDRTEDSEFELNVDFKKIDYYKIFDENDTELSKKRKNLFSFIFQETNMMTQLSVYQNILFPILFQYDASEIPQKEAEIHDTLIDLELTHIEKNRSVFNIAGGEKQRFAFARALCSKFEVLICDEPTGNLDYDNAHNLLNKAKKKLNKDGKSAIIVTHNEQLAEDFGDTIIRIGYENYKGKNIGHISQDINNDEEHI